MSGVVGGMQDKDKKFRLILTYPHFSPLYTTLPSVYTTFPYWSKGTTELRA